MDLLNPQTIVATVASPTRVERSVPLKALVSQINYNLFDVEVGAQQSQFAFLQAKDLADAVDGLMRTHDVALWNGNDTSLSAPTTTQYFGAIGQIQAGGNKATIGATASMVDGLKSIVAQMVASSSYEVRPTAIYASPVTLDLIDQEMKAAYNVVLSTKELQGGFTREGLVDTSGRSAVDPRLVDWIYAGGSGRGRVSLLHRFRRPGRVSLADGCESACVPAGNDWDAAVAAGGGEIRRGGSEGRVRMRTTK